MSNCVSGVLSALFATVCLVACGGGSDSAAPPVQNAPSPPPPSPPPPPPPSCVPAEGAAAPTGAAFAVGGAMTGRADPSFILLPVPNPYGSSFGYRRILAYGPDLATSSTIAGFIDAGDTHWCDSGQAYNGYDHGVDGGNSSNANAYVHTVVDSAASTVSGSVRSPLASHALSGTSLPGAAVGYAFSQPASIADIAGTWTLNGAGGLSFELTIADDGTLTAKGQGASAVGGRLTASAAGVNLFDYSGAYPSAGIGMSYPLANGQRQLLFIWYENDFWYYIPHVAIGRR